MKNIGVIQRVEEPQIGVPKPNGRVQICVDLTKLNLNVCRERHILPSVRRCNNLLDANSGFWQIALSQESARLTTYITPFRRYVATTYHSELHQHLSIFRGKLHTS